MSVLAVIPARWGSSRLPGKPLADIHGLPMVEHVRRRVAVVDAVDRIIVATDDERVAAAVRGGGGEAVLTGEAATGTDRVAQIATHHRHELVLCVQGDMPLLEPDHVSAVIALLRAGAPIATLAVPLEEPSSPHEVKVVRSGDGRALYFSRQPIPHRGPWLRHLGLYGFQREVLLELSSLPPSPLEQSEGLEQLRWMEAGMSLRVGVIDHAAPSVDTREQLDHVRALAR